MQFVLLLTLSSCLAVWAREDGVSARVGVQEITESNADLINEGEWMLEFFAPWCPACQKFDPVWKEFGAWAEDVDVKVGRVDVTAESGLSGRFLITALPTIYHVKNKVYRIYDGHRSLDDLMTFIEEKKWDSIEPVAWWWAPSSPVMVLLGATFKVSMALRDVHRVMTESYGIPNWAAYGLFALGTIFIGVAIGTMIVCLADCFVGRRPVPKARMKDGVSGSGKANGKDGSTKAIAGENVVRRKGGKKD